jgi:hypothetical protein
MTAGVLPNAAQQLSASVQAQILKNRGTLGP